jgi:hypothetical protein
VDFGQKRGAVNRKNSTHEPLAKLSDMKFGFERIEVLVACEREALGYLSVKAGFLARLAVPRFAQGRDHRDERSV